MLPWLHELISNMGVAPKHYSLSFDLHVNVVILVMTVITVNTVIKSIRRKTNVCHNPFSRYGSEDHDRRMFLPEAWRTSLHVSPELFMMLTTREINVPTTKNL